MSKKDSENKQEIGRVLYLNGAEVGEIAEKLGVTRQTVSKWKKDGGWDAARAAKTITRTELVNKLLITIDKLITDVNASEDPNLINGLSDKLAKLSSVIEKLDKKTNVVDAMEVFMSFSKWMSFRAETDPEITPQFLKTLNRLQDAYVIEKATSR